jgi:hypothetical protein
MKTRKSLRNGFKKIILKTVERNLIHMLLEAPRKMKEEKKLSKHTLVKKLYMKTVNS